MNENERAIEIISAGEIDYSGVFDPAINKDVETIILEALREKVERNKGCEYCDDDFKIWQMQISGELPNVRFCPMCGRRLEVEQKCTG